jgi:hypothetical protein
VGKSHHGDKEARRNPNHTADERGFTSARIAQIAEIEHRVTTGDDNLGGQKFSFDEANKKRHNEAGSPAVFDVELYEN